MTLPLPSTRVMNEHKYDLCVRYKSRSSTNQDFSANSYTMALRGITHEMRTPLTNINLSLAGLTSGTFDPELLRYFDIIERSTKKLNDLIALLLSNHELAVVEGLEIIDLNDVITDVLTDCSDRLALKQISCALSLSPDRLPVLGNRANLTTAFHNIVINAIDAMEEGSGVLTVVSGYNGSQQHITVADNGVGMSKSNLEQLFIKNFTTKPGGMGIGLSVTKQIIDNHNGSIDVTSQVGEGTAFRISFLQSRNQLYEQNTGRVGDEK